MSKKKKEEVVVNPNILSPEKFFEWRYNVEKLSKARAEQKSEIMRLLVEEMKIKLAEKDLCILRKDYATIKVKIDSNKIESAAKKEYDEFRARLEKEIGQSLEGKCIDEYTREITKI